MARQRKSRKMVEETCQVFSYSQRDLWPCGRLSIHILDIVVTDKERRDLAFVAACERGDVVAEHGHLEETDVFGRSCLASIIFLLACHSKKTSIPNQTVACHQKGLLC